jgi:hypothetical protein
MGNAKGYVVVSVVGGFGERQVGYWVRPAVKSGWVPLATLHTNDPDDPAIKAVVTALQVVVDDLVLTLHGKKP